MIAYIQDKKINYKLINDYLSISKSKNHWTNNGPVKNMLEDKISELINLPSNKRVLCVSNGTTAWNIINLYYSKTNENWKWISPSYTFPTCATLKTNIDIVDIDPTTYTLSDRQNYTNDGIVITNLFGSKLKFNCNNYTSKIIIYDNASSFLSTYNNKNICLYGDMAFSSLHHTKTLGFGEGGFIVLNADLYEELQSIATFGFTSTHKNYNKYSSNFKMSDTSAAFILQHIETYNIKRHYEIQNHIKQSLTYLKNINLFEWHEGVFYGNIPLISTKPISIDFFKTYSIVAQKYYKPLIDSYNSLYLYDRMINLPLHCDLTDTEIDTIIYAIKQFEDSCN